MDNERIRYLVEKFDEGTLSPDELNELEQFITQGTVDINAFPVLGKINRSLEKLDIPDPGKEMDTAFYNMLNGKLHSGDKNFFQNIIQRISQFMIRLPDHRVAYPTLLLITGLIIGAFINFRSGQQQIRALNAQMSEIHDMLVVSLLEKPDATDRLKAVSLSMDLKSADQKVIDALLNTLNHDENVNVRLAAIDALYKYSGNEKVRKGFIEALSYQDSPIVLVTLADVLVSLQEKGSVDPLKKLLKNKNLDDQVKDKILSSIKKIS